MAQYLQEGSRIKVFQNALHLYWMIAFRVYFLVYFGCVYEVKHPCQ